MTDPGCSVADGVVGDSVENVGTDGRTTSRLCDSCDGNGPSDIGDIWGEDDMANGGGGGCIGGCDVNVGFSETVSFIDASHICMSCIVGGG